MFVNTLIANRINFKGKIIDMHTHIGGHMGQISTKNQLDVFVKQTLPNNDNIEYMIVSDTDSFKGADFNEYDGNKKAITELNGDKNYKLMAGCAPHNGNVEHIKRIVSENPTSFVGLKFHPQDVNLSPLMPQYKPYFDYADEKGFPCLFHTQVPVDDKGLLFRNADASLDVAKLSQTCDPQLIYDAAKQHPKTPFIMAHLGAGWNQSHSHAIDVLVESVKKGDANLYADISWVDIGLEGTTPPNKENIVAAIKRLMGIGDPTWDKGDQSFRLMFGTDAPIDRFANGKNGRSADYVRSQYSGFVESIKDAIRNDGDLKKNADTIIENLFYNNAKNLFKLSGETSIVETVVTQASDSVKKSGGKTGKIIAALVGAAGLVAGGTYLADNKNDKRN